MRIWRFGDSVPGLREVLERGGILAIPTESSYGLAADPRNERGVRAIYQVKGRDSSKALPVVASEARKLSRLGIDPAAPEVAPFLDLWPAPLTVIAPISAGLPAAGGRSDLAVRIPDHGPLRDLLRDLDMPLTATSANRSGKPPALSLADLEPLLGEADAVAVDGGDLPGGAPSTLVERRGGVVHVLRVGRFSVERLKDHFSAGSVEIAVENAS